MTALLQLRDVSCSKDTEHTIFSNINFNVNEGDVAVLHGKSGSGQENYSPESYTEDGEHFFVYEIHLTHNEFVDSTAKSFGVPLFRTKVFYVPQRPSLLPGTPSDFLAAVSSFSSRRVSNSVGGIGGPTYPIEIASQWGIDEQLWDRNWLNLSGGESQRIALAIAIGLNTAEVLLLDEPTSALDPQSTALVEALISRELRSPESELKAILWITHSEEQGRRVGTRFLRISNNGCEEEITLLDS